MQLFDSWFDYAHHDMALYGSKLFEQKTNKEDVTLSEVEV